MATQEQGNEAAAVRPKKPKKPVSPVRTVVGLVLVVVLATVAYLEFTATRGYNEAVAQLEKALEKEDGGLLTDKDVEKMLGRAADGPAVKDATGSKVTYSWRGAFRTHRLGAIYNDDKTPHLLKISTE